MTKYSYSGENAVEETAYAKKDGKLVPFETKENIYANGIDDIVATVRTTYQDGKSATATYFFQKNHEGSVVAIADASGKTVDQYRYDAFGKAYVRDGKSDNFRELKESKIGNSRLFTGREYDAETGTYYYRARTYDAGLGRFLQRDPIGTKDQVNLYTYVANNSVKYADPRGGEKRVSFIRENEWSAWFLSDSDLINGQTGHARLYFISGQKEYLVSFYPNGASDNWQSSTPNSIWTGDAAGDNHWNLPSEVAAAYHDIVDWRVSDAVFINNDYLDATKMVDYYRENLSSWSTAWYNTFVNNCSDEVKSTLEAGWFFKYTEFDGIATPVPWNLPLPGTSPSWVGYDIRLELAYRSLFD